MMWFSLFSSKSRECEFGSLNGFGLKSSTGYNVELVEFVEAREGMEEEVESEGMEAVVGSDWNEYGFCKLYAEYLAFRLMEPEVLLMAIFGLCGDGEGMCENEGTLVQ
ncbi:hypothetical protein OGATHE_006636 [Ogataea polymorpha]|uniref:Uncharacterized protein n=1 Tax=Ogataea polymorpha TaxID=460523 RepID=A0A9P8SYJ8_9ASCO|nr:hypothetical protein OGATHE_006636 [Ogataea polymorpha]